MKLTSREPLTPTQQLFDLLHEIGLNPADDAAVLGVIFHLGHGVVTVTCVRDSSNSAGYEIENKEFYL